MTLDEMTTGGRPLSRRTFLTAAAAAGAAVGAGNVDRVLAKAPATRRSGAAVAQLKFWDMVWGPPQYISTAKKLVDQFNATHPSIQVTYQSTPWANQYQTFTTAIASGSAPDLSTGSGYQAFQFADTSHHGKNNILSIDSLIASWKKNGTINDFLPGTVAPLKFNGHQVAIPWAIDIRVWYYRKDLFRKAGIANPPTTWAEFRAAAEKLSAPSRGAYGFGISGDGLGAHNMLYFMINNGGGLFSPSGQPDLPYARNVEALQFLVSMVKDGLIDPAGAGWSGTDLQKAFGTGRVAMYLDGPGSQANYPASLRPQIGMMPPLVSPHGTKGTIFWINNIMAYSQTKYPEETMTFMDWLSKNELPLWTQGANSQLPVRKSYTTNPYFKDPFTQEILDQYIPVAKTTATRAATLFPQLNTIEGEGFLQTMPQQVILGTDVKTILSTAVPDFARIMKGQ
jgi:multiple sugar transport system substrate-binding protein